MSTLTSPPQSPESSSSHIDLLTSKTKKATRDSYGEALLEFGHTNPLIVALDCDLSVSTKSALFAKKFPERFFQMGISESNMLGVAAGLSFDGFIPFASSFGAFVVGRYETIRVSCGYAGAPIKIIGTHAGLAIGEDGYSQMGLEDVSVLRALPNIEIFQPCEHVSTYALMRRALTNKTLTYIRLTRQALPPLYNFGSKEDEAIQQGKMIYVRKKGRGKIALCATGAMTHEANRACEILQSEYGLLSDDEPWVIDVPCLKPLDTATLCELGQQASLIVTLEDHNIIGGLGSMVLEYFAESYRGTTKKGDSGQDKIPSLYRIGVEGYGQSGSPEALYDHYGLSAKAIAKKLFPLLTSHVTHYKK